MLIDISLIFFTLEMKIIQVTLTSETFKERQDTVTKINRLRNMIWFIYIFTRLQQATVIILEGLTNQHPLSTFKIYFGYFWSVLRYFKCLIEISMCLVFLTLLRFFVKIRLENLRRVWMSDFPKLTKANKAFISWSVFLCILTFYKTVTTLTEVTGHFINNDVFYGSAYYRDYA